jgi:uncharacterized protein (TIGR02466 family)
MDNYINVFGIPIFNGKLEIEDKIIKKLKNISIKRLKIDNGFTSTETKILHKEEYISLRNQINDKLNIFLYDIIKIKKNQKFKLMNSWINIHKKNDWAQAHEHSNSYISGIVYLDVNDESGKLVFYKERNWLNIFPKTPELNFEEYNEINSQTWSYIPKNNDIFLFPSFLTHSVEKNLSNKDRYSLAFNFYPEGEFGSNEENCYLKI